MSSAEIDILDIDQKIKQFFGDESNKILFYKSRLEELKKTLNSNIPYYKKKIIEKDIEEIQNKMEKNESNKEVNFYISETIELIEMYKNILKTPIVLSFTGKNKEEKKKNDIISEYVNKAQKYWDIKQKFNNKKFKMTCNNCTNKKDFIVEENCFICSECNSEQELQQYTTSYKDSDRINISTKYTYDRKVHFRDCISQYQGKQNCSIDPLVYVELEDIFDRHHLLVGDKKTKKQIRFSKITKENILLFLKELNYAKHYENVNLIHYNLTNKKPDDISHLEDKLIQDFDLLIETYDKNFKNRVDRVNFISTQYVLYQLLQRHKHHCKKEDFVMLKTVERKTFHDNICGQLFNLLSWNFTPLY
jgi:hypothetical protein